MICALTGLRLWLCASYYPYLHLAPEKNLNAWEAMEYSPQSQLLEHNMPLVHIYIHQGKSSDYIKAVGDGINSAVIETMGFPEDDRYQIIHQLDPECLQLQNRQGDAVIMHLVMRAGRSNKSKQAFYKKVAENLQQNPGIAPANVLITITENHDIDWSFGDGIAQFVA